MNIRYKVINTRLKGYESREVNYMIPIKLFPGEEELKIGSLSQLTGVKAGTIRFYEKCGFLEPAKRLPNGYRVFCKRHIYQIRVCRLVFGGFVNKRLRKISRGVLQTSRDWDLEAYRQAADRYLQAVEEDIRRTKLAVVASEAPTVGDWKVWQTAAKS